VHRFRGYLRKYTKSARPTVGLMYNNVFRFTQIHTFIFSIRRGLMEIVKPCCGTDSIIRAGCSLFSSSLPSPFIKLDLCAVFFDPIHPSVGCAQHARRGEVGETIGIGPDSPSSQGVVEPDCSRLAFNPSYELRREILHRADAGS